MINKNKLKDNIIYLIGAILSIIILIIVFKLWNADLKIPFNYGDDGLAISTYIKGMVDNNSIITNKYVGYPGISNILETPMSDWLHIIIIRIIAIITKNYAITLNLYYLMSFPLITITSIYVFKKFNINNLISLVGSLLYAFIPYHFLRGEYHLFLSAYYIVPLTCLIILKICSGSNIIFRKDGEKNKLDYSKTIGLLILCLLIASSGVYYAFFTCFFLILSGIFVSINKKDKKIFISSILIILFIVSGSIINVLPNIIYTHNSSDKGTGAVVRSYIEPEIYGLKITQLVLPISGHRINKLASFKERYNLSAPLINENNSSSLGIVGTMGFLISIIAIYIAKKNSILKSIGLLNMSAIFLASIGGFSTLFAVLVTKMIRGYNRISIYMAFFSIFAVMYILNIVYLKIKDKSNTKHLIYLVCILILAIGILDQTSNSNIPNYSKTNLEYNNNQSFINEIETIIPKESKVFQLPYVPYPEEPSPYRMGYYDSLKPYLHSKDLYWSFGSIKGKSADTWQKEVSSEPVDEFIDEIKIKGFSGIFIDSFGYDEETEDFQYLINELEMNTGEKAVFSNNQRYAFIKIK